MIKKKKKTSIIISSCTRNSKYLLEGKVLAIDPSSGSEDSQPGFASYEEGQLKELGTIEIGSKYQRKSLGNRLFHLHSYLLNEFDRPDILVIERCPFAYANNAAAKLQQATGCIKSVWDVPIIEVSPASWKRWIGDCEKLLGFPYVKSDDIDAAMLGLCCISLAAGLEPENSTKRGKKVRK